MSSVLASMLESNAQSILAAYSGVSEEAARWRPAAGRWSLLEILCHLLDEERDDFRRRIRLLLEDPAQDWPPIDPEGWVRERDYKSRELAKTLADFAAERAASLLWLRELPAPDWSIAKIHPRAGRLRAGDLLAAWAAHDLLHLRQIFSTKLARLEHSAEPYSISYASP